MPDFILFDTATNNARKFTSEDWYLGCVDTLIAENPGKTPVPVNDSEARARYLVYGDSPGLSKAIDKAKSAEEVPGILEANGAVAGSVYLDTPSLG